MRRRQLLRWSGLLLILLVCGIGILTLVRQPGQTAPPSTPPFTLSAIPLTFEANVGQTDTAARFLAHLPGGVIFFTSNQIVLSLQAPAAAPGATSRPAIDHTPQCAAWGGRAAPPPPDVLRLRFEDALPTAILTATSPLQGQANYFVGSDPGAWHTGVPLYSSLTYRGLYPQIDLRYNGTGQNLEGTYYIAPGGDPSEIRWRYEGAAQVALDAGGRLQIALAGSRRQVSELPPQAWQERGGQHVPVPVRFDLDDEGLVGFALGAYDPALPLVIDPTLSYATYLGGSGDDVGWAITTDAAGNTYLTGPTNSPNFPLQGGYQPLYGGGYNDVFVTKFNAAGTRLVYSTYLGGSGEDMGLGLSLDAAGNVYLAGSTGSPNFPLVNPAQATYGGGNVDAFVAELSPTGGALLYSTYLGGTLDDCSIGVARGPDNTLYTAGYTASPTFPMAHALQPTSGGSWDAFVTRLTAAGSALLYSTYLGGSDYEFVSGFALDSAGNAYITGVTASPNFPVVAPLQPARKGAADAFVAKVNPSGSALVYATYLGGSGEDAGGGVAVDGVGNAYLHGSTHSPDFPLRNPLQPQYHGNGDAFVAKVNAAGSALLYATYLGGGGEDTGWGIAVDGAGNAYLSGATSSSDFPLLNPLQPAYGGQGDAYIAALNASGTDLQYATFLGGSEEDESLSIALDSAGNAYAAGYTTSPNFPVRNAYQPGYGGGQDAFVAKITAPPPGTPVPTPSPPAGSQTPAPPASDTSTPAESATPAPPTAVPTTTPCILTFHDVPPDQPFYPFIRCLSCRGIISGYGDTGYLFRPETNVTRGQLAKIIANAAGLHDPIPYTQRTFEDVAPANPFWIYVERLSLPGRGVISGYQCGQGPAGPCLAPGNRAYFLPGNDVTRGQVAKMVASAAQLSGVVPSTQQTFEDISSSSPFWTYVERLAPLQVISGYRCEQGPAGPCIAPGNRPYFLPGNAVTRGQTAKIVANTFFPTCQTPEAPQKTK